MLEWFLLIMCKAHTLRRSTNLLSRNHPTLWCWLKIQLRLIFGNVIRCSALRLWVGFFLSILNSHPSSFNRLISKGMPNIHLKVIIEKNWDSQSFDFLSFKNSSPGYFLGSSNSPDIIKFWNFLLQRKSQRSRSKSVRRFSIILIVKGNVTF